MTEVAQKMDIHHARKLLKKIIKIVTFTLDEDDIVLLTSEKSGTQKISSYLPISSKNKIKPKFVLLSDKEALSTTLLSLSGSIFSLSLLV